LTALLRINDLQIEGRRNTRSPYSPIVKGVSLEVNRGEVLALIGESGAGKSTIALASMGYAKPGCRFCGGEVLFDQHSVLDMTLEEKRAVRGARISYVAQSAAASFNASLRLDDQITEVSMVHNVGTKREAEERMIDLARRMQLPHPEEIVRKYPHQVSGGQLQRLMAVMAMNAAPDLLVLDEPTTALDVTTQVEVLAAFKDTIRDSGAAAIYVTHDLAVVAQIADRIKVLLGGETIEEGTTEQILHDPQQDYTRKLMAAVRPPPKRTGEGAGSRDAHTDNVIEVNNIDAGYGRKLDGSMAVKILHDVSVEMPRGSAIGVIGESGCGKSTLARVISGLLPAAKGETLLDGQPLAGNVKDRDRDELRRVQIVMQMPDVSFNPLKSIGQAMGRPLEFYLDMPPAERRQRVAELLQMVDLPAEFASRRPQALSGGQKQRVNLARALAANPEVILCDEVTSALDTVVGAQIIDLLKRLQDETSVTFVFISHDLSTVASFADRVVVLYAGRVAEQGPTAQVLSPPYHPYTSLLLHSVPEMRQGWLEEIRETETAQLAAASVVEIGATGCPFHKRCPLAIEGVCDKLEPPVRPLTNGHRIACHREIAELGH
jgi:peptide/nickel transport system ATP-binding protein